MSFIAYLAPVLVVGVEVALLAASSDDDEDDITCARCAAPPRMQDAVPEKGDEWQCHRCNVWWAL